MEITELGSAVRGDVDMVGVDVTVRDAAGVGAVQRGGDVVSQLDDGTLAQIELSRENAVGQTLGKLHADQVGIA